MSLRSPTLGEQVPLSTTKLLLPSASPAPSSPSWTERGLECTTLYPTEKKCSFVFQDLFSLVTSTLIGSRNVPGVAEGRKGNSGSSSFSLTNVKWVGDGGGGKQIPKSGLHAIWG